MLYKQSMHISSLATTKLIYWNVNSICVFFCSFSFVFQERGNEISRSRFQFASWENHISRYRFPQRFVSDQKGTVCLTSHRNFHVLIYINIYLNTDFCVYGSNLTHRNATIWRHVCCNLRLDSHVTITVVRRLCNCKTGLISMKGLQFFLGQCLWQKNILFISQHLKFNKDD